MSTETVSTGSTTYYVCRNESPIVRAVRSVDGGWVASLEHMPGFTNEAATMEGAVDGLLRAWEHTRGSDDR